MIARDSYLNQMIKYLDTEFIKVITGVRRSGKSFLLKLLKERLTDQNKQVMYLNFEHPDTFSIQTSEKLYSYIVEKID